MKRGKGAITIGIAMVLTAFAGLQVYAGQWQSDSKGWWYDEGNGTYPVSGWQWIDGNGDGIAESYYFDENGYCLTGQVTPDGYQVNGEGAWVENGSVQTKRIHSNEGNGSGSGSSSQGKEENQQAGSQNEEEQHQAVQVTAQDIMNKNPSSYRAGAKSVYGSKLSQAQLNQVAEAVAAFKNAYITDDMSDRQKIRAAHDYLVYTCSYAADWSQNGANTAWGALIYHEAQCSGYARAFKALCDAIDIDCYYVHANAAALNPSHQWNIVRADGIWYHIDVQANDSSRFDAIYLSTQAPVSYNEWEFPPIGEKR